MRLNRSVLRAAALIKAVAEHPEGATAAVLAVDTDLPRPTAFRLLLSLEHAGFIERSRGRFTLGPETARLGRLIEQDPVNVARASVASVASEPADLSEDPAAT